MSGQAYFLWDRNSGDLAFMGNVQNVDLQNLLAKWNIHVELGELRASCTTHVRFFGGGYVQGFAGDQLRFSRLRAPRRVQSVLIGRAHTGYGCQLRLQILLGCARCSAI